MTEDDILLMDSRTKNGTRNIVMGAVNRLILVLLPFCTRTLIVKILGQEYLGISGLFSSILNILNLSELGFGSVLVFSMYKPIAANDNEKICALLKLYKKIYTFIGITVLIIGLGVMPFLPKLIEGDYPQEINLYMLYGIFLFNTVVSYFVFAYKKALLIAYQRSDILSNVNSIVTILTYGTQIALLLLTKNYYVYIIALPIFTLVDNIATGLIADKKYRGICCKGDVTKEDKIEIKQHVKGIALQKLCSTSRNAFDSIIISMFLGLTMTAIYGNYYYIMYAVHSILYMIPNSIRASVGNSVAQENEKKNYKDFRVFLFLYSAISSVCTVCMFCLYQPFMQLWMGEENLLPIFTMSLFCMYFLELSLGDMVALYKDGAGLWWYGRYRTIIEAVANLVLNIVLGKYFGLNGILIATIITIILFGIGYGGYIVYKNYFKHEHISDLIMSNISCVIITSVSIAASYGLGILMPIRNPYLMIITLGVICVVVSCFIWWLVYRKSTIYLEAKKLLRQIYSNK